MFLVLRGWLPFHNSLWRGKMYPYPAAHSVILRSGRSGWCQLPKSLEPHYLFWTTSCHQQRGEREMCAWCSLLVLIVSRHTGYPSQKACARETNTWIERTEVHPYWHSLSLASLLCWCLVWGWVACTFCTSQGTSVCFCLQLRAAVWHSLIPLVISQVQWFLFLFTWFTAGGTATDLDLLCLAQMTATPKWHVLDNKETPYLYTPPPSLPASPARTHMHACMLMAALKSEALVASWLQDSRSQLCCLRAWTSYWTLLLSFPCLYSDDNIIYLTGLLRGLSKTVQCLAHSSSTHLYLPCLYICTSTFQICLFYVLHVTCIFFCLLMNYQGLINFFLI